MPMEREAPTWLVTGAHGFLGANLGHFLAGRVHRIGAARTNTDSPMFDRMVAADLADPYALAREINRLRPDVVVHTAALADHARCEAEPDLATLINADVPRVLSLASEEVGARFIHISTDAVFDGAAGPYSETDAPHPFSVYGQTKLEGEQGVLEQPNALVVRTNFFGWSPSGRRSILEFFVTSLSNGEQVKGFTDFTVTSIYAQHLCDALWRLAHTDATGILHVAASDELSKYDFGVSVAQEFSLDASLITPTESDIVPSRRRNIALDVSRASAILGAPLPSQRDGLAAAHADVALRQALRAPAGQ
jgi:dTDP-4-dehydrorhamnose reductase